MTRLGYPLMTEQSGPRELVRYAAAAEDAGFDFVVSSDHPAVVAQKAATLGLVSDTRFVLGVGSGESSIENFAPLADQLIAVEPDADPVAGWRAARSDAA